MAVLKLFLLRYLFLPFPRHLYQLKAVRVAMVVQVEMVVRVAQVVRVVQVEMDLHPLLLPYLLRLPLVPYLLLP